MGQPVFSTPTKSPPQHAAANFNHRSRPSTHDRSTHTPLPTHPVCPQRRSVLLLEDKTPIGRVEEVFGPLTMPLYALRYTHGSTNAV